MIVLVLLAAAVVFFLLAAFGVESRVSWTPLGYACVTAAWLAVMAR